MEINNYSFNHRSSILRLSIGNEIKEHQCGIVRAYEMSGFSNGTRYILYRI